MKGRESPRSLEARFLQLLTRLLLGHRVVTFLTKKDNYGGGGKCIAQVVCYMYMYQQCHMSGTGTRPVADDICKREVG